MKITQVIGYIFIAIIIMAFTINECNAQSIIQSKTTWNIDGGTIEYQLIDGSWHKLDYNKVNRKYIRNNKHKDYRRSKSMARIITVNQLGYSVNYWRWNVNTHKWNYINESHNGPINQTIVLNQ